MPPRRKPETIVGRLRAADPFELIRWLARSQPDPRKALAELVQNSLDAGAHEVRITRLRERGATALHVVDDGEGIIPELGRTEALTYIATHIGHSRKRNLTPEQRRELMLQGQYGIGLLGFWAIGQMLEMRTQLPDQPGWVLRLYEDSPRFEVERLRSRLALGERYTEVVIRGLHRPAVSSLTARRMADYLAVELRGQLLQREVKVTVHDRIARGRAPKVLAVKPARFEGQRLVVPEEVATRGYAPIRVELYVQAGSTAPDGQVAVSCGGTVVYDHIEQFEVADFRHAPWTDRRLAGLIEFPDFQVAPGTRRGVVPNPAATAFADALRVLEPLVVAQLEQVDARAAADVGASVLRQLERAFREVPRVAPEYDFFAVRAAETKAFGGAGPGAGSDGAGSVQEETAAGAVGAVLPGPSPEGEEESAPELLIGAALAALHVVPAETRVECLGSRRFRAEARDAAGVRIRRDLSIRWEGTPALGAFVPPEGTATAFQAGAVPGTVSIVAEAREADRIAVARASIEIVEELPASPPRTGIPEPVFIDDGAGRWRSRVRDGRWEVNAGHPDFRAASETARRKVRYLAALLAKEVVLHSFPAPQLEPILERLVEVLTITERGFEKG
jgi:hypothetical protein